MKHLAAIILALMIAMPAQSFTTRWYWTEPVTGSPVTYYEVEINTDNAGWDEFGVTVTNEIITEMPTGASSIRVRGVDEFGRVGLWSEASDLFIDAGAPGGCGVPIYDLRQ